MRKHSYIAIMTALCLGLSGCGAVSDSTAPASGEVSVVESPAAASAASETAEASEALETGDISGLSFETEDIHGNPVSAGDYADAKLIMLNFWEPWCGPCVGEMPELEALYEQYKEDGFVIIGAFTTTGQDEDVLAVMEQAGITYPIVRASEEMYYYMTEYVPTTILLDGAGHLLSSEPIIGANSREDWENIIAAYMEQ